MKKIAVFLTILFLVLAPLPLYAASSSNELNNQKSKLSDINKQLSDTRQTIEKAKKEESTLTSQINETDRNIAKIQSQIENLQEEFKVVNDKRQDKEDELEVLQVQLEKTTDELAMARKQVEYDQNTLNERVVNSYKHGKVTYFEVLLNSTSFADFLNRANFLKLIIEQDYQILRRIKMMEKRIATKKEQIEAQKDEMEKVRADLLAQEKRISSIKWSEQTRKNEQESQKNVKQGLLAKAEETKEKSMKQEKQLLEDSRKVEQFIKNLEAKAQGAGGGTSPVMGSGKFIWPLDNVNPKTDITSEYGYRIHPVYKYRRFHSGIDIAKPGGTRIKAAGAGKVIFAGWFGGYGQTVMIDHGGGYQTLYAHTSAIYVSEGQTVSSGTAIAAVGSTGVSTGNHLHFEVRINGSPQNPRNYL